MNEGLRQFLVVEDRFQITGRGLILAPDFDVPPTGKWKNFSETVVVVSPSGEEKNFEASFTMAHFNIRGPNVPISKRWRVVVTLPNAGKEEVPIGSKVFGSSRILGSLVNGANQE